MHKHKDPLNQVTEYGYTLLGQLSSIKQTDGVNNGPTLSFAYTYYSPLGVSWIEQLENSNLIRLQGFGYNPRGQAVSSVLYNEAYQHNTYYSYDYTENQTGVQDPFSHVTQYGDDKNRLVRVVQCMLLEFGMLCQIVPNAQMNSMTMSL